MNAIILPYKNGSQSARALANELELRQIRLRQSSIHRQRSKTIINWGNSGRNLPPEGLGSQHTVINGVEQVRVAGNKLLSLQALSEAAVTIPEFVERMDEAQAWLDDGHSVVERHQLTGNSGAGIRFVDATDEGAELQEAPLYTKYVKKHDEYRIHVMSGQVIDVQRKARRTDTPDEEVNWQIRNHDNGFIFARQDVSPPTDVMAQSMQAVTALGLDFGAVDVVYNQRQGRAYVLEVNTAPGLEGTTLERYAEALRQLVETGVVGLTEDEEFAIHERDSLVSFEDSPAIQNVIDNAVEESREILEALARAEQVPETEDGIEDTPEIDSTNPANYTVGTRVRVVDTPYSVRCPNGTEGVVEEVTFTGVVRIRIPNSSTIWNFVESRIRNGSLEIISEEITETSETESFVEPSEDSVVQSNTEEREIQVGDTVRIAETSVYFDDNRVSNPPNTDGVVIATDHIGMPIRVNWGNGRTNVYYPEDLVLVSDSAGQVQQESTERSGPVRYAVTVDRRVDVDNGIFDTLEEAEMAMTDSVYHNMRSLGHTVQIQEI